MSETPNPSDAAERLRRLQERRAASGRSKPTAVANTEPEDAPAPATRSRRRHPAAATRIFLAGLSVTSFFSVATAIAVANHSSSVGQSANPATNSIGSTSSAGAAAQPGTGASTVVHTVTRGS